MSLMTEKTAASLLLLLAFAASVGAQGFRSPEEPEELRTSYYGGFSSNFKAGTLGSLGERLH